MQKLENWDPAIARIEGWVKEGKVKPRIYARFPLSEFRKGLMTVWEREAVGKTVLIPP